MLIKEKGKKETTEGIELPNLESIRTLGKKENYKYFRILAVDTIKQTEIKVKVRKAYFRKYKLLKTKLCGRNFIKGINTCVIVL